MLFGRASSGALSNFFLAKDLDLLVSGPVDWLKLYGAKLLETLSMGGGSFAMLAILFLVAGRFIFPLSRWLAFQYLALVSGA